MILNPRLYEQAKEEADKKYAKPSAYKSGFIVKRYKDLGGKYADDGKERTLGRWFKEEWGDIGGKDYPVYRPFKRITKDTPLTASEIDPVQAKKQIGLKQRIRGNKNLPPFQMRGGKLSASDLKNLLNASYEKTPSNVGDWVVDKSLSGQRAQVYQNSKTGQVVVAHRGSASIQDFGNDLKYVLGSDLKDTKRYKHAEKVQKEAEAKYGADKVTTIGHSLGSLLDEVGKNSHEIISLNKPIGLQDRGKDLLPNETAVRTERDPVSILTQKDAKDTITIPSTSWNPLTEHSPDVLDRLPADTMIGRGQVKRLRKTHLKDILKKLKMKVGKKNKKQLIDEVCYACRIH
jgi:hypothetical protein